jgi:aldehyde:ferredoxin oxidoreductase
MEPRQPIAALHEASRLVGFWVMNRQDPKSSPVTNEVFRKAAARFWKHDKAWDFTTIEGKAETASHTLDRTYVKDSLLLCDSNWPVMFTWHTPDRVGDPALESRTFTAVTGVETDETELQRYGGRIFNLQRAVLLREGRRPPAGDIIPEFNFTEPVQTVFMNPEVIVPGEGEAAVDKKGTVMDRADYRTMLREFYELRGWDTETGLPTQATLEALDLADIVPELTAAGGTADETE